MINIFHRFHKSRGTRTIRTVLRLEYGRKVSRERIKRIMNKHQLFCTSLFAKPKSNNKYAREKIEAGSVVEDLIQKNFRSDIMGQNLFTDISYFYTKDGSAVYLAALIDGFNREIKAFKMSTNQRASLVVDLVKEAYANGTIIPGLSILHSDQGSQFKAKVFQQLLQELKVTQSMSPARKCTHNGLMEGVFGVIKNEMHCLDDYCINTVNDVMNSITSFISYFNTVRITNYTGGVAPVSYRLNNRTHI